MEENITKLKMPQDMEPNEPKKPNKFWQFVKNNKMSSFLFVALVAVCIWALVKIYITDRNAAREVLSITNIANQKVDSIRQLQIEQTATIFSWAIRSELSRQNMEQVDQFFMTFVRQPGVNKLYLIDPSTNKVLLSTDKKEEGSELKELGLNTNKLIIKNNNDFTRVISPVMGLNEKIGILIIDFNKNK